MIGLIVIALVVVLIYFKMIKPLLYWKERGVVYKTPLPIVGNSGLYTFQRKPFFYFVEDVYNEFAKERYFGLYLFQKPVLYIKDTELIKRVTVKDFDYFIDHNKVPSTDLEPIFQKSLFGLKGQKWRSMRATMSPLFTTNKMKILFSLVLDCADQFKNYFEKDKSEVIIIDVKDVFSRYTSDIIATVIFGFECNSLEEKNNEFYVMGKLATTLTGYKYAAFFFHSMFPKLAKWMNVRFLSIKVANYFNRIVKETLREREIHGTVRHDMIKILMEARKGQLEVEEEESAYLRSAKRLELTDEDIVAQAVLFFFAGFETTSITMVFIAYELAVNRDVQEKLQAEIDEILNSCNGKLTYEAVTRMKYIDMVLSESLRKWPAGFSLDRMCVQDYTIEPERPWEKPLTIKKGTAIIIPVVGIHLDPQYYPNPEKFDPERFSDENKHKIVPHSYFPFGAGPRSCIANRFSIMEIKTFYINLLSVFDIIPIDETRIPIKASRKAINLSPEGGLKLGLRRRTNK